MASKNILLVEDEYKLSQYIQTELINHEFNCDVAYDGLLAKKIFASKDFDLVLLDINIPGISGLELCKEIHLQKPETPIIMITALGDLETKLSAYDYGAQDYLVKPIHMKELLVKVNIFIKRRLHQESTNQLKVGELLILTDQKKVFRNDKEIELTPKEFDLLNYLAQSPKRVISKNELSNKVWAENYIVSDNTIEVYISFLRHKLDNGFDKKVILTKHGFGYYLNPEVCL